MERVSLWPSNSPVRKKKKKPFSITENTKYREELWNSSCCYTCYYFCRRGGTSGRVYDWPKELWPPHYLPHWGRRRERVFTLHFPKENLMSSLCLYFPVTMSLSRVPNNSVQVNVYLGSVREFFGREERGLWGSNREILFTVPPVP